jgi:transcriptional regulator with XRE-family HTH domain
MIGREVRRRREELGLTGVQLAARSGLSPGAISQIENGKRTPSSTTVMKLAQGLGVEVGELYPLEQPRLPEWSQHPPGEAYFVEPEEGEEADIVTLRFYVWRELEKDDALVQKVAELLKQRDEDKAKTG